MHLSCSNDKLSTAAFISPLFYFYITQSYSPLPFLAFNCTSKKLSLHNLLWETAESNFVESSICASKMSGLSSPLPCQPFPAGWPLKPKQASLQRKNPYKSFLASICSAMVSASPPPSEVCWVILCTGSFL